MVLSLPRQRYVEVIGELARAGGTARMTDVAQRISVSLPSASEAVKRLVEIGIASRGSHLEIELTEKGRRMADQLEQRHQALQRFMVEVMAMDPAAADELACRLEHAASKDFAERLIDPAQFLEQEYPWAIAAIATHVRNRHIDLGKVSPVCNGI
jgi:DtxR family Mn-dependent transcriptional regulator